MLQHCTKIILNCRIMNSFAHCGAVQFSTSKETKLETKAECVYFSSANTAPNIIIDISIYVVHTI